MAYISNLSESSPVDGVQEFTGALNLYGEPIDGGDMEAPTIPTLFLDDVNTTYVDMSWTQSTDNLAVTGYELRKITSNQPEQIIDVGLVNLSWKRRT